MHGGQKPTGQADVRQRSHSISLRISLRINLNHWGEKYSGRDSSEWYYDEWPYKRLSENGSSEKKLRLTILNLPPLIQFHSTTLIVENAESLLVF